MPRRQTAGSPKVSFSNIDKIFYPEVEYTKGEVIRYYLEVAPYILPHLEDRPITLIRFPDGVRGESFYEKNVPKFAPEWIQTFPVPRREPGEVINYILINDANTLAWCANLAAIELHPFLHRVPLLDRPTHIAFDLDPGDGADILTCAEVALILKEVFERLGLQVFPKVSGSKGIQLYLPLNTKVTYDLAQPFAKAVAELLEQRHPKLIVSQMSKTLRRNRVMIDWSQNSQAKTTVAVYALRAKREQPFVSMPVEWKELKTALSRKKPEPLFFSPDAALARLKKHGDLFAPLLSLKQELPRDFIAAVPKGHKAQLGAYVAKRNFDQTPEPTATMATQEKRSSGRRFVIQKHAASHLHYDFRLEMDGALKSWAVPKGLPYGVGERRSAFATEDHPLEYLKFEGTIPQGQYGGGTVMVWDLGTYTVVDGNYYSGKLRVALAGKKLKGEWQLVRIREEEGKPVWLVSKVDPPMKPLTAKQDDSSVLTRRSMEKIASDNDAQWQSNR